MCQYKKKKKKKKQEKTWSWKSVKNAPVHLKMHLVYNSKKNMLRNKAVYIYRYCQDSITNTWIQIKGTSISNIKIISTILVQCIDILSEFSKTLNVTSYVSPKY